MVVEYYKAGLTYLSRYSIGMELAPYFQQFASAGCQGFIGPFPSAFLDKRCVKNWYKDMDGDPIFPNPLKNFIDFSTLHLRKKLVYNEMIKMSIGYSTWLTGQ